MVPVKISKRLSKNLADFFDKLKRGLFYSRPLLKLRLYFS